LNETLQKHRIYTGVCGRKSPCLTTVSSAFTAQVIEGSKVLPGVVWSHLLQSIGSLVPQISNVYWVLNIYMVTDITPNKNVRFRDFEALAVGPP
jgi:hypothetical protein